jgi:hypothetical protein
LVSLIWEDKFARTPTGFYTIPRLNTSGLLYYSKIEVWCGVAI